MMQRISSLNRDLLENLPLPLFTKEGYCPAFGKRSESIGFSSCQTAHASLNPHFSKGGLRGITNLFIKINSPRGFTLLELTISIALIGIIVLIVTGAMRLGTRAIESGEKRIASLERTRSSLNIIDAQIQSYVPLVYIENGEKKYYFTGDRETLRFSTNYSIWGGEKGYVITTYSIKSLDNGKQAIFVSETVAGRRNKVETMLTNPFERISFEFFSKDPTEETGKWMDQWTDNVSIPGADKVSIPQKVKIHFIEGADDLSLVIPIRVKMSAADLAAAGGFEEEFVAEQ
jgi:general secretion pathway protein J